MALSGVTADVFLGAAAASTRTMGLRDGDAAARGPQWGCTAATDADDEGGDDDVGEDDDDDGETDDGVALKRACARADMSMCMVGRARDGAPAARQRKRWRAGRGWGRERDGRAYKERDFFFID